MREIKFRAWNGRKMFDVDVLAINGVSWDSGGTGVSLAYQPSIKVMQYTGLKDKNDIKLCEGDVFSKPGHWLFYIEFSDGGFVMIPCNPEERIDWVKRSVNQHFLNHWEAEVVGNIHENPELCEA